MKNDHNQIPAAVHSKEEQKDTNTTGNRPIKIKEELVFNRKILLVSNLIILLTLVYILAKMKQDAYYDELKTSFASVKEEATDTFWEVLKEHYFRHKEAQGEHPNNISASDAIDFLNKRISVLPPDNKNSKPEFKEPIDQFVKDLDKIVKKAYEDRDQDPHKQKFISYILGHRSHRITLMHKSGAVIAESGPTEALSMLNHKTREEFKEALNAGYGQSIRSSGSVDGSFFYYAEPVIFYNFEPIIYIRMSVTAYLTDYIITYITKIAPKFGITLPFVLIYIYKSRAIKNLRNSMIQSFIRFFKLS